MRKTGTILAALLCLSPLCAAQSRGIPRTVNFRYSAQISNSPAGTCGCFGMHGAAGDAYWNLFNIAAPINLGLAADAGVEHTGALGNANYGLTLTTVTAGPRVETRVRRLQIFGQALIGFAHGSGSQFPQGNSLIPSANSFALDLGGAADMRVNGRISLRIAQLDYLRTQLPNATNNLQNNLRAGAGITMHFGSH